MQTPWTQLGILSFYRDYNLRRIIFVVISMVRAVYAQHHACYACVQQRNASPSSGFADALR
jgi:hypothetical protein